MKTDELITLLAAGEGPVDRHALARRLAQALLAGLLAAVLMTVALYGVRSDLADVARVQREHGTQRGGGVGETALLHHLDEQIELFDVLHKRCSGCNKAVTLKRAARLGKCNPAFN